MKYGKINHVGIVVKDWNEATDRYGKLFGIKHWYEIVTDEGTFDLKYHGEKKDCKVRIFYGGKGTTKLEIIETQGAFCKHYYCGIVNFCTMSDIYEVI